MSRLEELIQELCPDGVEYKKVKDIFQRLKGTPITASKMKEIENPDGEIRVFAGGKTIIDAKEKDIPKANIIRVPAVLVQSRGIIDVIYYEKPFTFKNEMWAYTANEKITVKFLYYVLKNNIQKFREAASGMGSLPQISLTVTEDFFIPVPPLEVQREIVRILDSFVLLTEELTTKLTTELIARKKQYEHYREEVFNSSLYSREMHFGDIFDFQNGFAFKSKLFKENGNAILRITNIKENKIDTTDLAYFDIQDYKEDLSSFIVNEGEIVIAMSGATTGKIGINNSSRCLYLNQRVGKFIPKQEFVLNKFLYYILLHKSKEIYDISIGGAQPNLSSEKLKKICVLIPPIEEQKKMIKIFDEFDAYYNNLKTNLFLEIETRHKQYAYYRDKLLSFKEVI